MNLKKNSTLLCALLLTFSACPALAVLKTIKTEADFNTLVKEDKHIIVDFYATWCPPCNALSPKIDELAKKLEEVSVVKVDIEKFPGIANRFSVRSIPTLKFITNGKVVTTKVGSEIDRNSLENQARILFGLQ